MINNKKLILFDLDGVLLDSRPNMAAAWDEVCRVTGVTVPFEDYFTLIGRPFGHILDMLGLGERAGEIDPVFRKSSLDNRELAGFYPNVPETLQMLVDHGALLGIVTSKDKQRTDVFLAKLPVQFTTIQTPNARYRGKPAPDHLLAAMAEAHTDPAASIYIGDMDADFMTARRAAIDYAHAAWGYGPAPADCSIVIESIDNVLDLIGVAGE